MMDYMRDFHARHAPRYRVPDWVYVGLCWAVVISLVIWAVL